jgi:hypothetical protein
MLSNLILAFFRQILISRNYKTKCSEFLSSFWSEKFDTKNRLHCILFYTYFFHQNLSNWCKRRKKGNVRFRRWSSGLTPHGPVGGYQCFRETYCFHLQGEDWGDMFFQNTSNHLKYHTMSTLPTINFTASVRNKNNRNVKLFGTVQDNFINVRIRLL